MGSCQWSHFCNSAYNFTKLLPMLGHDLQMSCIQFHENPLIFDGVSDGEIDEKHALQIIALLLIPLVSN